MKEIKPYRELWKKKEQDNRELREIIEEKDKEIEEMKKRWEELYKIMGIVTDDKSVWINDLFKFIKENKIEFGCKKNENDGKY